MTSQVVIGGPAVCSFGVPLSAVPEQVSAASVTASRVKASWSNAEPSRSGLDTAFLGTGVRKNAALGACYIGSSLKSGIGDTLPTSSRAPRLSWLDCGHCHWRCTPHGDRFKRSPVGESFGTDTSWRCCSAKMMHSERAGVSKDGGHCIGSSRLRGASCSEPRSGGQDALETPSSHHEFGAQAALGLLASAVLGGTAQAVPLDAEPWGIQASASDGPAEFLLGGGSAALLSAAVLLLGLCLVTPVGKDLLRRFRPCEDSVALGPTLEETSEAVAPTLAAATTVKEAYVPIPAVNGFKSTGQGAMESIKPTLDETRRLLRDFEGLSLDMAAAGVDMAALAGKLRSLQGSLDACAEVGARTAVEAGVLAAVGAAAGGEERRVALCLALLQNNDSLRLTEPAPELDATTVAWLEQYLEQARVSTPTDSPGGISNGHSPPSASPPSHADAVEHLNRALHKPPAEHPFWKGPGPKEEYTEENGQAEAVGDAEEGATNGAAMGRVLEEASLGEQRLLEDTKGSIEFVEHPNAVNGSENGIATKTLNGAAIGASNGPVNGAASGRLQLDPILETSSEASQSDGGLVPEDVEVGEAGKSNGTLVSGNGVVQETAPNEVGPSEAQLEDSVARLLQVSEGHEASSSLGGMLQPALTEAESSTEENGAAEPHASAQVLEQAAVVQVPQVLRREEVLERYWKALRRKRAKDCVDVIEAGHQAGVLNLRKHVSHQRVLQLCAAEPDAALSVRFLTLFPKPTLSLLTSVMMVCAEKADVDRAFEVMHLAKGAGIRPDCPLYTGLIATCTKAGRLDLAFKVFHDMEAAKVEPNRYTFATLIHGCAEVRQVAKAFGVYSIMLKKNVTPDRAVFNSLINACGRSGAVARAFDVYGDMAVTGLKADEITLGTLVNACAQAGELERAVEIYSGMVQAGVMPSRETYTALVHACSKEGDVAKALAIYADMRAAGMDPDEVVFSALIDVAGNSGQLDVALYLLTEMRVSGVTIGAVTYGALIGMFGKAGMIPESERLFEQMQSEGIVPSHAIYNALIGVKGRAGQLPEALELLKEMRERGIKPDRITYSSLLHTCADLKEADLAFELYHTALEEGVPTFLTACKVLVELCATQVWSKSEPPAPGASVGSLPSEVESQSSRTQWAYRALQVYRDAVAAGLRVPLATFSQLLGCFKLPATPRSRALTPVWRSGRVVARRGRTRRPIGQGLFKDDGAGLYSPGAVALYEEVATKGLVPQCNISGPATLDLTHLPPNVAEVCILAILKRVRLRKAAGVLGKVYPITLKLKTHLEPSPNKEMEGHMIHICSRSGIAVGSLLRRLHLRFHGHESSGSITISAANLRRWLRPPLPRRRRLNFAEQQRAIRLGQRLPRSGRPRVTKGAPMPGPKPGSKPAWYPKIGGWQTSEGYNTAPYSSVSTDDETSSDEEK